METDLPTHPHDPRWRLSRRTMILMGAGIQVFFVLVAGALISALEQPVDPPLLVREVLIPEDMVYRDTQVAPRVGERRPPVDVEEISVATPARLKEGQGLFSEHCVSCHGEKGEGDGPAGVTLEPRPRDLTALAGWKRGVRLSDLFRTVTLGLEGMQMPGFDYLSVEERFALAHHVAGLAPGRPRDTREALDSLDVQFSLSAGAREPNLIPLSTAMDRLVAEAPLAPLPPDAERVAALATLAPRGAALFARVIDPDRVERAGYLLKADSTWVGDPARLKMLALSNAPTNGFRMRSAALSTDDWAELNRYLTRRYRAP